MVQQLREILVLTGLVVCQFIYKQVYPLIQEGLLEPPVSNSVSDPGEVTDTEEPDAVSLDKSDRPKVQKKAGKEAAGKRKAKFKVGQVVQDKAFMVRGVVVAWEVPCEGTAKWRKQRLLEKSWAQDPCYHLLLDSKQSKMNITYAPEITLESLLDAGQPMTNPLMYRYFRFFDGMRYIPDKHLMDAYPQDVPAYYRRDLDKLDSSEKGQTLLRVVEEGYVAHGAHVPGLERGAFLVASQSMELDVYKESVILILEHDDSGTKGLLVNKKMAEVFVEAARNAEADFDGITSIMSQFSTEGSSKSDMKQLLQLMQLKAVDVRVGGAVLGVKEHVVLHPFSESKSLRKVSTLVLSGSGNHLFYVHPGRLTKSLFKTLVTKIKEEGKKKTGARPVLLFIGYTAWGSMQLAGEVRGGLGNGAGWGVAPASLHEVVRIDQSETWANLYRSGALQFYEAVK